MSSRETNQGKIKRLEARIIELEMENSVLQRQLKAETKDDCELGHGIETTHSIMLGRCLNCEQPIYS